MSMQPGMSPAGVPAVGAGPGMALDADHADDVPRDRDTRRDADGELVGRADADADADAAHAEPDPAEQRVDEEALDAFAAHYYDDRSADRD